MATFVQYTEEMGQKLIDAAKRGGSETSFRGIHGITRTVWDSWCAEYPAFLEAIDLAVCCQVGFYEEIMNEGMASSSSSYRDEGGMTEKERCFLARDRLNHLDAQNLKVNGRSLSTPKKDWEEEVSVDLQYVNGSGVSVDSLDEFRE